MEEKEKKTVEIISKEDVEKLIKALNEIKVTYHELKSEETVIDTEKIREVVAGLERHTVHTIVTLLATAMLVLPAGAIMAVVNMGKSALKMKALGMLAKIIESCKDDCDNCPDCPTACDEAPKE